MKHILYMSRATHPLTDQNLQDLLAQCRHDNALNGITGILFYSHGNIAQLFEGEEAIADALFARIAQDGRHTHVTKHVDKPIADRSFTAWSMAFHPLEPASFDALQGFVLPHQVPPTPTSLPIADALLLELVRLAVFGPDPSAPYPRAFPGLASSES
jgi:hypothetical protein